MVENDISVGMLEVGGGDVQATVCGLSPCIDLQAVWTGTAV